MANASKIGKKPEELVCLIIKREGRHNTLEYAIQLKNVTKTFGKVVANKNVNLDVKKVRFSPFWEKMEVARPLL